MRYRTIPATDLTVSEICLGAGAFGSAVDRERSFQILDQFVEAGGTFIDTARAYAIWTSVGAGASERVIGQWLAERKLSADIVVASKGGHPEWSSLTTPRMSARDIIGDCEESLRTLAIDSIPLYWLHRDDPFQPVESLLQTLESLVQSGKIRYYGCSNWRPDRIRLAQTVAQANGWQGFVADQPMWSLALANTDALPDKTLVWMDDALLEMHRQTRLTAIPYTAQARGVFAKVHSGGWDSLTDDVSRDYDNMRNRVVYDRLKTLSHQKNVSITALSVAWLINNPDFVTIPIVSARSREQWNDILSATAVVLTAQERAAISG